MDECLTGTRPIESLPGQYHYGLDSVHQAVAACRDAGVGSCILFGLPKHKDARGSSAWAKDGVVQEAIRAIKAADPDFYVITDVCLCEYTDHGHCGLLKGEDGGQRPHSGAPGPHRGIPRQAGADMVAPSDMMDGRVAAIREALDDAGFANTPILSYSAKYASAFYGPFRSAAGSAPAFGDRAGLSDGPPQRPEALKECALDVEEGADLLMVKPALSYLDVIRQVRDNFDLPLCAYSVSGSTPMIKAAAAGWWTSTGSCAMSALSVFRAGADMLITYYAKELAQAIRKGDIG